MTLLSDDQVSGSTPEGSEHYAQAHLLFGFEREYLMPAPEQKVVNCPCGAKLLLRWTGSIGSAIYPVRCPECGAEHRHHATPPVEVYRLDSKGNWEYVTTILFPEPRATR